MTKVLIIISFKIRYTLCNFQVIQCLKCLTNNYKTLVIASIHQPNNDILMNFDSIHVLSNAGLCVYWGSPQDVKTYLLTSNIICHDFQIPIEVIIKIATKGSNDRQVKHLSLRSFNENSSKISEIKENKKNSLKTKSKAFKIGDICNLLMLTIRNDFLSRPKTVLIQYLMFAAMYFCLTKCYNQNIGQIDGCFDLETYLDMSCKEVEENKKLIEQNLHFLYMCSISLLITISSISNNFFTKKIKTFSSEHMNSMKTSVRKWSCI